MASALSHLFWNKRKLEFKVINRPEKLRKAVVIIMPAYLQAKWMSLARTNTISKESRSRRSKFSLKDKEYHSSKTCPSLLSLNHLQRQRGKGVKSGSIDMPKFRYWAIQSLPLGTSRISTPALFSSQETVWITHKRAAPVSWKCLLSSKYHKTHRSHRLLLIWTARRLTVDYVCYQTRTHRREIPSRS